MLDSAQAYMECIEQDGIVRYGHPKGYAWHQQRNAFVLDKQLELASRVYKLLWANQETPAREVLLVDRWSILSPFTNYKILAKQLVRSTLDDHFFLVKSVRRYREKFIEYLRGKNAFSSRRWFTDDPVDQEPMIPHPEEVIEEMLAPGSPFMKARMKWVEQQETKANSDPRCRLDLSDLPKFGDDVQRSLTESLMVMTPGLAVLLLTFGLSVMITIVRFLRYDPR